MVVGVVEEARLLLVLLLLVLLVLVLQGIAELDMPRRAPRGAQGRGAGVGGGRGGRLHRALHGWRFCASVRLRAQILSRLGAGSFSLGNRSLARRHSAHPQQTPVLTLQQTPLPHTGGAPLFPHLIKPRMLASAEIPPTPPPATPAAAARRQRSRGSSSSSSSSSNGFAHQANAVLLKNLALQARVLFLARGVVWCAGVGQAVCAATAGGALALVASCLLPASRGGLQRHRTTQRSTHSPTRAHAR